VSSERACYMCQRLVWLSFRLCGNAGSILSHIDMTKSRRDQFNSACHVYFILYRNSWGSSVGVKISVGVDDLLFYCRQEKQTFCSPQPPDQLWVTPSLLFSG
jgi:hypothetical protein